MGWDSVVAYEVAEELAVMVERIEAARKVSGVGEREEPPSAAATLSAADSDFAYRFLIGAIRCRYWSVKDLFRRLALWGVR